MKRKEKRREGPVGRRVYIAPALPGNEMARRDMQYIGIVLYCIVLYCTYCIVLYCTVLYAHLYSALHCTSTLHARSQQRIVFRYPSHVNTPNTAYAHGRPVAARSARPAQNAHRLRLRHAQRLSANGRLQAPQGRRADPRRGHVEPGEPVGAAADRRVAGEGGFRRKDRYCWYVYVHMSRPV
jgi:hypothetical protein